MTRRKDAGVQKQKTSRQQAILWILFRRRFGPECTADFSYTNARVGKFYEGTVWYGRSFDTPKTDGDVCFSIFGAVSYRSKIYLNGEKIASHEGGFTPFQVEITDKVKQKDNFLVVKVNNTRTTDAIGTMSFDWWNCSHTWCNVDKAFHKATSKTISSVGQGTIQPDSCQL